MNAKDLLNNVMKKNEQNKVSVDYRNGYEACEKKYKTMEAERDTALAMIKKLGYVLGESPDPLRSASYIKKECKSQLSCENCHFYSAEKKCILEGVPSEWRII